MSVYIRTFGCSANKADSEVLAGCLAEAGYKIAESEKQANVIIYNSCAVKGPTENRIIDEIKHAPIDKKIIVAGCLPKISFERLTKEVRFDAAIGPSTGKEIVNIVSKVINKEKVVEIQGFDNLPSLELPRLKSNPVISIIPINYGCLGSCAYCCVIYARGHLRSYNKNEISKRVTADAKNGAKEFWLTSQDTACYGRDLHCNLAELLKTLEEIPGDFKIRLGMMTPNMLTDMKEQLIEAFQNDRIFKFLHLPIQSGDNKTLKRMRRFYTTAKFKSMVSAFRSQFPNLTLATDIIVGYPGETTTAFKNTLKILKEVQPDVVNVSKFFARPKTAAAKIQEGLVEKDEIKRRSKIASELVKQISLQKNLTWIGWTGNILIDEKGKVEGTWVGRNFAYKPIVVESPDNLLGKAVKVKITEAFTSYLKGQIQK